jgi:anion-transporting  ArsA/GET3 family ATPase
VSDALRELVTSRRVLVCVGAGGVGKTTVAGALALEAARRGRRAVVITIDPARRLADALGVDALGNQPHPLPPETLASLGVGECGELSAMMLDMKRTLDDLVERFAPDAETRERILANPIYQHVSDALAGTAEYSAMEKVYELSENEAFELIVVDTPPSQHALDFLDAPQRLMEFLDSRLVHLLVHPAFAAGRFGFRIFQRSAHRVLSLIERVSGVGFLEDISDFLLAFEGMSEGFRERARRVRALLLGPDSGFLLVSGPGSRAIDDARRFLDRLEDGGVPVAGLIFNRMRTWPEGGEPPARIPTCGDREGAIRSLAAAFAASEGEGFPAERAARAAIDTVAGYASAVRRDREATGELVARVRGGGRLAVRVPELPRDVHDLEGLARIAAHLFAKPGEPRDAR